MFFQRSLKKVIAFITALAALSCLSGSVTAFAAPSSDIEISLEYGYNGFIKPSSYVPFSIELKNNGSDFEGSVWLLLPINGDEICGYERKVSLAAGSSKKIDIVGEIFAPATACMIQVQNTRGKVIAQKRITLNCDTNKAYAHIGILSDDYNALSSLSGYSLDGMEVVPILTAKLSDSDIMEDSRALDMLDGLIITDYASDRLTEGQRKALLNRVAAGGLLIVGTGTGASKVLKGFPELKDISIGDLRSVDTTFGEALKVSFSYEYSYSSSTYYMNLDTATNMTAQKADFSFLTDPEYLALTSPDEKNAYIYDKNSGVFMDYFWSYYFGESYVESAKWNNKQDMLDMEKNFRENCLYEAVGNVLDYYEKYLKDNTPVKEPEPDTYTFKYVHAEITEPLTGETIIKADTEDGGVYPLVNAIPYGKGTICVIATDISKEPFVNNGFAKKIISNVILYSLHDTLWEKYNNVGWYGRNADYDKENLADHLSFGSLLPLPVLFLIFAAYTALAFSAYFILKKRKKSIWLWAVQPALALAATLLIMITSLATKMSKPVVNAVKITELTDTIATEDTVCRVVLPKSKRYTINFAKDYKPSLLRTDYYNYYNSSSSQMQDLSRCNIGWMDDETSNSVSLLSNAALSSEAFTFTVNKPISDYDIRIEADYTDRNLHGRVTNNTNKTLEQSVIILDYLVYDLGTITPGETVDLSSIVPRSIFNSLSVPFNENVADLIAGTDERNIVSYIMGFKNRTLRKELLRRKAADYVREMEPGNILMDVYAARSMKQHYQTSYSTWQELYEYCDLDQNGHPYVLTYDPYFICFNEDNPGSILEDHDHVSENITEIIYKAIPITGIN